MLVMTMAAKQPLSFRRVDVQTEIGMRRGVDGERSERRILRSMKK